MVDSESDGARLAGAGRRWTRRAMTVIIAVLALAGFTAIVLYSYDTGEGDDAVPLIRAAAGPHKARPEEPGGMSVPDQDKQVFSRLDPGQAKRRVERLLPPPEEVLPPPPPRAMAAPGLTGVAPETMPAPVARPATSAAEAARTPAPAPAKISAKELVPPAIEPPAGTAKTKQPAAAVPAARPPAGPAGESTAAKPRAPSAKAPSAGRRSAALTRSYRIQLASYRSEASVKRRWAELRRKNGDLLGGLRLFIDRADLGPTKGVYYRMQAGPLANSTAALALCARIKRRNMGCLVVTP